LGDFRPIVPVVLLGIVEYKIFPDYVYYVLMTVGYIKGKRQAVNTGVSSFQNPGGSTAATTQASLTVTHGNYH